MSTTAWPVAGPILVSFLTGIGCMAIGLGLREVGYLTVCRALLMVAAAAMAFAGVSGLRSQAELADYWRRQQLELFRMSSEYYRALSTAWSVGAIMFGVFFFLAACFIGPVRGT